MDTNKLTYGSILKFSTDMAAAPKDRQIYVLVPTGDASYPLAHEFAAWAAEDVEGKGRFEGEWRFTDQPYSQNDPIAWADVAEIDADLIALANKATAEAA